MTRITVLAAALLAAGLLGACAGGGNGFPDVDYCPDAGCPRCWFDWDCHAIVDCCGTNWCTHVDVSHGICKSLCPQLRDPPPVHCRGGRCTCG